MIGGNRYTEIDLEKSILAGETVRKMDQLNEAKLDDVFMLNFALTYRVNMKKTTHEFKIDIQNATNNQAAVDYYYDEDKQQIDSDKQLSILPNIMYIIKF